MKQTNPEKLEQSKAILQQLKEARGGSLLESHRKMGNDPYLAKMFLDTYQNNQRNTRSSWSWLSAWLPALLLP